MAEGVWVVQGGQPGRCNVYLIEDEGGVTMYDAGARTMVRAVAAAGAKLGGIRRVVLGHGHTDHRGTAPALGVPVYCHPAEVQDAEGSGGFRYWPEGLAGLPTPQRQIHRAVHRFAWDGGPVKIAGTVEEGDEVAGFKVIDLPGHAPGLIGLWRESDRLALVSDTFYTWTCGAATASRGARRRLQLRHRAGPREHPQACRTGARRGVAGPRQAGQRATCAASWNGPPTPAEADRHAVHFAPLAWGCRGRDTAGEGISRDRDRGRGASLRPWPNASPSSGRSGCRPRPATTATRRATC